MLACKFNLVNGLLASLRYSFATLVVKFVGFGEGAVGAEFVFTSKLASIVAVLCLCGNVELASIISQILKL